MVKIALLLTGQLRSNLLCRHLHKNILIDKYDTDIFISVDKTNNIQNCFENITDISTEDDITDCINFYKPIKYFISNSFDEEYSLISEELSKRNKINFQPKFIRGICQQYYIVKNAYQLLINHIEETNKKYDIVIRLRFDQYICNTDLIDANETNLFYGGNFHYELFNKFETVDIMSHKKNPLVNQNNIDFLKKESPKYILQLDNIIEGKNIYVFGFGLYEDNLGRKYEYVNDQFFAHSQEMISIMHQFYDQILDIIDEYDQTQFPSFCQYENVFYRFLRNNNIKYYKSAVKGIFIRTNHKNEKIFMICS